MVGHGRPSAAKRVRRVVVALRLRVVVAVRRRVDVDHRQVRVVHLVVERAVGRRKLSGRRA